MAACTKKSSKSKSYCPESDPLVNSAVKLIDQAASLLKRGILTGAEKSADTRHTVKVKASHLVNEASEKLQDAIDKGASTLRKGLRKL
ncbi:MAG: hypothetical protein HY360_03105 [Verrucomicrobia bacterium]|nr:hypothetical protein [Verrucomicrobiota bacterium]